MIEPVEMPPTPSRPCDLVRVHRFNVAHAVAGMDATTGVVRAAALVRLPEGSDLADVLEFAYLAGRRDGAAAVAAPPAPAG